MKTKHLLTTLALACMGFLAQAQQSYEEVVYLKNGGIMRGVIIEQVPNKSLKIQTIGRNVFVYQMDEIEKITKESIRGGEIQYDEGYATTIPVERFSKAFRPHNEWNIELGGGFLYGYLNTSFGRRFSRYFYLGLGTGASLVGKGDNMFHVPVFLDMRLFFNPKDDVVLFWGIKGGLNISNPIQSLAGSSLGITFPLSQKLNMNIALFTEVTTYQSFYSYSYSYYYSTNSYYYHGTLATGGLKVGLNF